MTKKLQPYFWLALLAHLLLLLSFSLSWVFDTELQAFEKKSDNYLPAYLYQNQSNPSEQQQSALAPVQPKPLPVAQAKPSPETLALKKQELSQQSHPQQLKSKNSAAFMQAESPTTGKPIDEPLLKELSRATASKLFYPRDAAIFKITGTVTISFLLYPDGRVTQITLVKSSGFPILDEAALSTIKAISPVRDANLYISSPKTLLAGIIFG